MYVVAAEMMVGESRHQTKVTYTADCPCKQQRAVSNPESIFPTFTDNYLFLAQAG